MKKTCLVLFLGLINLFGLEDNVFEQAERGFQERLEFFQEDNKEYYLWKPNWKEEDLKVRFDQIVEKRQEVYFINPEDCKKPNTLWIYKRLYATPDTFNSWGSRYQYPTCFDYNVATHDYSASIIDIHGKKFIAMEAPTKANFEAFCNVLNKYNVTDLVRLTPAIYNGREGSIPYWEGRININPNNGRNTINIADREINYFFTDCWEDHQGIEPKRLVALVKSVMNQKNDSQMLAVHCRAGVGRTGTFLAAYALMEEINSQLAAGIPPDKIKVSIDKVIWELSLQRPFMIAHFSQYLALYKFVDFYTQSNLKIGI